MAFALPIISFKILFIVDKHELALKTVSTRGVSVKLDQYLLHGCGRFGLASSQSLPGGGRGGESLVGILRNS